MNSNSEKERVAGAVGSKAARACDGCLRRRARWYCAADDAFLCQGCDTSVHSANPLARRHERLRLRPSSPSQPLALRTPPAAAGAKREELVPAWFTRKARTPRGHHGAAKSATAPHAVTRRLLVPELATELSDENKAVEEEEQEQLLYRVPIFDPALAEFCSPTPPLEDSTTNSCACKDAGAVQDPKPAAASSLQYFPESLGVFGPSDAELTEFAADMEALLGRGLDDSNQEDSFYMETLGLIESVGDDVAGPVKTESDGGFGDGELGCSVELEPEASKEMIDIDFDCRSPMATEEVEVDEKAVVGGAGGASSGRGEACAAFLDQSLALRLDYEAIIKSWGNSPWTDGERPHVNLDDCWLHHYPGMWVAGADSGSAAGAGGHGDESMVARLGMGGGREARVTRYREKRRTRLFSKKIRYEVRKLNAEKRPRMKGRFVKRATTGASAAVAASCLA